MSGGAGSFHVPREGVTAAVHRYLDGDGPARDLLARGVINYRGFARWLIDTCGWDATEEAVVSALRRYPRADGPTGSRAAREVLSRSQIHSRSNVCSISLPRNSRVHEKMGALFEIVDPTKGELLRVIEGDIAVSVIVSGTRVDEVREAIGEGDIRAVRQGLSEYSVLCPDKGHDTPGVLATIHSTLAVHDINVVESISVGYNLIVFVSAEDSLKAYQVLNALCNSQR